MLLSISSLNECLYYNNVFGLVKIRMFIDDNRGFVKDMLSAKIFHSNGTSPLGMLACCGASPLGMFVYCGTNREPVYIDAI